MSSPGRKPGPWVPRLEQWVARHLEKRSATEPLPTNREIALRYNVAPSTVFRQLERLERQGLLWRARSGRFYRPDAREQVEKPYPVACLTRQLEAWSVSYQTILAAVSGACGERRRSLLFHHNPALVQHPRVDAPPRFGSVAEQVEELESRLEDDSQAFSGFVLDHLWRDETLLRFAARLRNAVLLWRAAPSPLFGSVALDFPQAASEVARHLVARSWGALCVADPFPGDSAIEQLSNAVIVAARDAGLRTVWRADASTPAARAALVAGLRRQRIPAAVFCAEDNIAAKLRQRFDQEKLSCPERVGLVAGMGTEIARQAGITSLVIPFREIGLEASRQLLERKLSQQSLPASLWRGATT